MRCALLLGVLVTLSACPTPGVGPGSTGGAAGDTASSSSGAAGASSSSGGGLDGGTSGGPGVRSAEALVSDEDGVAPGLRMATVDLETGALTVHGENTSVDLVQDCAVYRPATREWFLQSEQFANGDAGPGDIRLRTFSTVTGGQTREVSTPGLYDYCALRGDGTLLAVQFGPRRVVQVDPVTGTDTQLMPLPGDVVAFRSDLMAMDRARDRMLLGVDTPGNGTALLVVDVVARTTRVWPLQLDADQTLGRLMLRPDGVPVALAGRGAQLELVAVSLETGAVTWLAPLDFLVVALQVSDAFDHPYAAIQGVRVVDGGAATAVRLTTVSTETGQVANDVEAPFTLRALALP